MLKLTLRSLFISLFFSCCGFGSPAVVQAKISPALTQQLSSSELYQQGFRDFEARQYRQAIASFLELLAVEPNNFQAYNMVGMSFGGLEEYAAALAAFERAIALNQEFANAYYNRGYVYKQLGQFDFALADFDRTLTLTKGKHISALVNRSVIYAVREDYPAAIADLTQVIEQKPDEAIAYYNRAIVNLTMGDRPAYQQDLAAAEELYRQAGDKSGLAQISRIKALH
ncbi:MAG: tetratricopeptide repeat protein [Cyanobacteria bacterium J06555_3]